MSLLLGGIKAWMAQRRRWPKGVDGINSVSRHGMLEVHSSGVFKVHSCISL